MKRIMRLFVAAIFLTAYMLGAITPVWAADFEDEWGLWFNGNTHIPLKNTAQINPFVPESLVSANVNLPQNGTDNKVAGIAGGDSRTVYEFSTGVQAPDKTDEDKAIYLKAKANSDWGNGTVYFSNSLYQIMNSASSLKGIFPETTGKTAYKYFTFSVDMYWLSENTGLYLATDRHFDNSPGTSEVFYAGTGDIAPGTAGSKISELSMRQWHNVAWQFSTDGTSNNITVYLDGRHTETYTSIGDRGFELAVLYFFAKSGNTMEVYLDNIKTYYGNTPYSVEIPDDIISSDSEYVQVEGSKLNVFNGFTYQRLKSVLLNDDDYILIDGTTKEPADEQYKIAEGDYLYAVSADGIMKYYSIVIDYISSFRKDWGIHYDGSGGIPAISNINNPHMADANRLAIDRDSIVGTECVDNIQFEKNICGPDRDKDNKVFRLEATAKRELSDGAFYLDNLYFNSRTAETDKGVFPTEQTEYKFFALSADVYISNEGTGMFLQTVRAGAAADYYATAGKAEIETAGMQYTGLETKKWYNIAWQFSTDGTDDTVKMYVDGVPICVGNSGGSAGFDLCALCFYAGQNGDVIDVYIDNIKTYYGNHAYVVKVPEVKSISNEIIKLPKDNGVYRLKAEAKNELTAGGLYFNELYYNANSPNSDKGIFPITKTDYRHFSISIDMYLEHADTGVFLGVDRVIDNSPKTNEVYYVGAGEVAPKASGLKITNLSEKQWHNAVWQFTTDGTDNTVSVYIDGKFKQAYRSLGTQGFELFAMYFYRGGAGRIDILFDNIKIYYGNDKNYECNLGIWYDGSSAIPIINSNNVPHLPRRTRMKLTVPTINNKQISTRSFETGVLGCGNTNIIRVPNSTTGMQIKSSLADDCVIVNGISRERVKDEDIICTGDYVYVTSEDGVTKYYTIQTYDNRIMIDETKVINTTNKKTLGAAYGGHGNSYQPRYGILTYQGTNLFREGALEFIRGKGIQRVRIGGYRSNYQFWKTELGELKDRIPTYQPAPEWEGADVAYRNGISLFGFLEEIKAAQMTDLNTDIIYCINLFSAMPTDFDYNSIPETAVRPQRVMSEDGSETINQEALNVAIDDAIDLMRFCLLEPDDPRAVGKDGVNWAQRRKDNGLNEPIKISVWEMGNEFYLRNMSGDTYTAICKAFIEEAKKVFPEEKLCAHIKIGTDGWDSNVINKLAAQIEYVSSHEYYDYFTMHSGVSINNSILDIKRMNSMIEQSPNPNLKVLITEGGLDIFNTGSEYTGPDQYTISLSASFADFMNRLSTVPNIEGFQYFGPGPAFLMYNKGALLNLGENSYREMAFFEVMKQYLNYGYGDVLYTKNNDGASSAVVSAMAVKTDFGMRVFLSNVDAENDYAIHLDYGKNYTVVKKYEQYADNPYSARNAVKDEITVSAEYRTSSDKITIKKLSVAVFDLIEENAEYVDFNFNGEHGDDILNFAYNSTSEKNDKTMYLALYGEDDSLDNVECETLMPGLNFFNGRQIPWNERSKRLRCMIWDSNLCPIESEPLDFVRNEIFESCIVLQTKRR